ncbi:HD-GYP domain-containing protein [Paraburkholderia caribensis]|uniref:HD-GYP domain-containing protein n=1 Tax=Paraburkholderia caribensis TaxID=75105 RepID=UPI0031E25C96
MVTRQFRQHFNGSMMISRLANYFLGKNEVAPPSDYRLLTSLLSLAWVVEARDPYTGGHLWRVSRFANMLARKAGLSDKDAWVVSIGGFLHDLGKIAVPDAVLKKADRLTDEEFAAIKTHPDVGRTLLAQHPLGAVVLDAVYSHHERPDGKGYPQGLSGSAIPRASAIIGICDAFDAMTSNRPYRKGMPVEQALSIIAKNLGTQFDRQFGEAFLQLGRAENLYHIVEHSDEGIPLQRCFGCGPTMVVKRETIVGASIFCPVCHGGYTFTGLLAVPEPSGKLANAADIQAHPDEELIARIVGKAWDTYLAPLAR